MSTGFTIESVTERNTLDASGNIQQVSVVYLKTTRGSRGSLEIPTDNFMALTATPDGKQALKDLIQEKADALDAPFDL